MLPIISPLAEKRILYDTMRRSIIGRRSYSDSIFSGRRQAQVPSIRTPPKSSESSSSSSTPKHTSAEELLVKAFTISAC
jgi:hypothetical protein